MIYSPKYTQIHLISYYTISNPQEFHPKKNPPSRPPKKTRPLGCPGPPASQPSSAAADLGFAGGAHVVADGGAGGAAAKAAGWTTAGGAQGICGGWVFGFHKRMESYGVWMDGWMDGWIMMDILYNQNMVEARRNINAYHYTYTHTHTIYIFFDLKLLLMFNLMHVLLFILYWLLSLLLLLLQIQH